MYYDDDWTFQCDHCSQWFRGEDGEYGGWFDNCYMKHYYHYDIMSMEYDEAEKEWLDWIDAVELEEYLQSLKESK